MILAQNKIRQNLRSPWKQRKNLGTVVVPRFFIWQRVKDSNWKYCVKYSIMHFQKSHVFNACRVSP